MQRPTPFVVRQVCYLGGKIFITFIKLKEEVRREELFLLVKTTVHYRENRASPTGLRMSDRYASPHAQ